MAGRKKIKNDFKRLMKYLKDIPSPYFKALSAFHVYVALLETLAINEVGKE